MGKTIRKKNSPATFRSIDGKVYLFQSNKLRNNIPVIVEITYYDTRRHQYECRPLHKITRLQIRSGRFWCDRYELDVATADNLIRAMLNGCKGITEELIDKYKNV